MKFVFILALVIASVGGNVHAQSKPKAGGKLEILKFDLNGISSSRTVRYCVGCRPQCKPDCSNGKIVTREEYDKQINK